MSACIFGYFPFNQNLKGTNAAGIYSKSFPENPEIVELVRKQFRDFGEESQISVYLVRWTSFPEIPKCAFPFVTVNFRQFKLEFSIEWKAFVCLASDHGNCGFHTRDQKYITSLETYKRLYEGAWARCSGSAPRFKDEHVTLIIRNIEG